MIWHLSRTATPVSLLILLTSSCGKTPAPEPEVKKEAASKPGPSMPQVKVTPAIQAKAQMPKPGAEATRKETTDAFGKGKASITVKGHPGGVDHSFWSEKLDVDGSGNPVEVDQAWDNRHKVLYLSKDRTFPCGNGQTAGGSTLMAVYGKGNTLGKPTGSGWWVVELEEGECSVPRAGIYGCRFDADGNNKDCGSATVQADQDDVVIVPFPGAEPTATTGSTDGAPVQPPAQPAATPAHGGENPK